MVGDLFPVMLPLPKDIVQCGRYSGCIVIAVDYALAPEYSFLHGVND